MGDQWLADYEKARKTAQQLAREVDGFASSKPDARQSALTRGHLAQLKQDITKLERSLMAMSQNTQAHNVTRKEVSRRGDLVSQLSEQMEGIQEALRNGAHRRRLENGSAPQESPWRREDADDGRDDMDPLQSSEMEIRQQDDTLDFLSSAVQNLKGVGSHISQEIDLHNKLLGDLEAQTETATNSIRRQQVRLQQLSQQSPTCWLWTYVVFISLLLLVLLIYF
eukprot:TRINITY_DN15437_c0_g1_i1.p1 TRINITY_DN15437_c0_g1~~TRINITY_DN15437_c0_g1_i1.p1  ORF type:complete len:224 (-),score=59.08 TRINITY_DN15437_c0_g1_i1:131-802(-)